MCVTRRVHIKNQATSHPEKRQVCHQNSAKMGPTHILKQDVVVTKRVEITNKANSQTKIRQVCHQKSAH